jgi:hypothetical protein
LTSGDKEGFGFGCPDGHTVSLQELSAIESISLRASLQSLIASWEEAVRQMGEGSRVASVCGFPELAERLQSRIGSLKSRIQLLRDGFLKTAGTPPPSTSMR